MKGWANCQLSCQHAALQLKLERSWDSPCLINEHINILEAGVEPAIFSLGGRCLIRLAARTLGQNVVLDLTT